MALRLYQLICSLARSSEILLQMKAKSKIGNPSEPKKEELLNLFTKEEHEKLE